MPNYTEHYNLIKPNQDENYNVDVANTNNGIIDQQLYNKVSKEAGKGLSSNDFTNYYKALCDNLDTTISNIEAAEAARVSAENTRISNESTRVSNEEARVSAETSRGTAESNRASAETSRVSAEGTRNTNETGRVNAEAARVQAETGRVNAEAARVSAEEIRQATYLSKEDTANKTTTIDENSTDTQYPTAKAVYSALTTLANEIDSDILELDKRVTLIENRVDISTLSWSDIQAIVKNGQADKYFSIGDQLITTWTNPDTQTEYEVPLDVVSFEDVIVLDENQQERTVPGMILQWHYCSPFTMVFDSREAFYVAPNAMVAGTYHFNLGVAIGNNAAGTSYQFTLQNDVPAGTQFVFTASISDGLIQNTSANVYTTPGSDTISETINFSIGDDGTDLGEWGSPKYASSGFNMSGRATTGYNRYSQSVIRQYLNADGSDWWSPQNPFDRISSNRDKTGFLSGFENDFLSVLGETKVTTLLNTTSDSEIGTMESTFDKMFLPSLQQCYCVPFAQGEGTYWEYWKQKSGTSSPNSRGSTNANLITYAIENHNSAQTVRLRSASRSNSTYAYYINSSGHVSHGNASSSFRFAPACVIC